jgi:hypothetical protein
MITRTTVWDRTNAPVNIYDTATDGASWMAVGRGALADDYPGKVALQQDGVVTDISGDLPDDLTILMFSANSGSTWLLGNEAALYKYQNGTFTDLTDDFLEATGLTSVSITKALKHDGVWWLFRPNGVFVYDGNDFTRKFTSTDFTAIQDAGWKGSQLLIIDYPHTFYLFNGTSLRQVDATLPSSMQSTTELRTASDGIIWVIAYKVVSGNRYSVHLATFNGVTFKNLEPYFNHSLSNVGIAITWSGYSWVLPVTNSGTTTVYKLKPGTYRVQKLWTSKSNAPSLHNNTFHGMKFGWTVNLSKTGGLGERVLQGTNRFKRSARVQSAKINAEGQVVRSVTISLKATKPSGTNIQLRVSNNGGRTWKNARSGHKVIFSEAGTDLRWRANLTTTNTFHTPTITSASIRYSPTK